MVNNVQQSLEVRLSNDELTFLLKLLGFGGVPGFSAAGDFPADDADAAMKSLIARGYAEPGEESPVIVDERVAALIGSGVLANRSYSVTYSEEGMQSTQWFYLVENFPVHHMEILPGVHRFRLMNDAEDVVSSIAAAMNLDTDFEHAPAGDKSQIPFDVYEHLGKVNRQQGSAAAEKFLAEQGLPKATINAMLHHDVRVICTMVQTHGESASAVGFMSLLTEQGYWVVEPTSEVVTIYPATVEEVMSIALDLLETVVG